MAGWQEDARVLVGTSVLECLCLDVISRTYLRLNWPTGSKIASFLFAGGWTWVSLMIEAKYHRVTWRRSLIVLQYFWLIVGSKLSYSTRMAWYFSLFIKNVPKGAGFGTLASFPVLLWHIFLDDTNALKSTSHKFRTAVQWRESRTQNQKLKIFLVRYSGLIFFNFHQWLPLVFFENNSQTIGAKVKDVRLRGWYYF